jgi:hypothetical protein
MVFEYSMFNIDESVDEGDSLDEDPTILDQLDEDEVEHFRS